MSIRTNPRNTDEEFQIKEHWPLVHLPKYLAILGLVLMAINMYLIFLVAPTDMVLGHIQRIFYIHVPMAILSFLCFFIVFIGSLGYFGVFQVFKFKSIKPNTWDSVAHSAAEVGVIFVTLALITGAVSYTHLTLPTKA